MTSARVLTSSGVFLGTLLVAAGPSGSPYLHHTLGLPDAVVPLAALGISLVSAWTVWLVPVRRWPLLTTAPLVFLGLATWPALCAACYVAATTLPRRTQLAGYGVAAGGVVLLRNVVNPTVATAEAFWENLLGSVGGIALFVALPLVIGLWMNARAETLVRLRERAEELERSQAARAGQARMHERARIAREMHDVVAHRVSLIVLHAGALEVTAQDEATAALIRGTGREALAQLREVLGVLRSPQVEADPHRDRRPLLRHLDRLLDESRSVGIPVERRDEGTAYPLPLMVEHTAYRVIQEALTNVRKHAGPVVTRVLLRYAPSELHVTVRSAASDTAPHSLPDGGFGLLGLCERVRLLQGELHAGPAPDGGFTVSATLPLSAPNVEVSGDPRADR
jgi:signal transduction histidine kinase